MSPRSYAHAAGALLLALAAGLASATTVRTNFLPETDFSGYRTYRWVVVENAPPIDSITNEQIKRAIDKQLAAKGWTKVEGSDDADAYVACQVAIERREELHVYGGYGYGWRWGTGPSSVMTTTIDIGTLTLDIYDPKLKTMVWRGTASDSLRSKTTPEKREKRLDKAMGKLLAKFPPQKSAK